MSASRRSVAKRRTGTRMPGRKGGGSSHTASSTRRMPAGAAMASTRIASGLVVKQAAALSLPPPPPGRRARTVAARRVPRARRAALAVSERGAGRAAVRARTARDRGPGAPRRRRRPPRRRRRGARGPAGPRATEGGRRCGDRGRRRRRTLARSAPRAEASGATGRAGRGGLPEGGSDRVAPARTCGHDASVLRQLHPRRPSRQAGDQNAVPRATGCHADTSGIGPPRMPAFLVHGVADTHRLWDKLRSRLSRRDVLAPSLPGFGAATPPGFQPTKEAYVDWLIDEIERAGEPVDLVGHDWGSLLVQRVVSLRPDLIRTWA